MKFEYKIKGITLNEHDMHNIKKYYEVACSAEYIMENYNATEEEAMELGEKVRRFMDKYNSTEEDAICEIIKGR